MTTDAFVYRKLSTTARVVRFYQEKLTHAPNQDTSHAYLEIISRNVDRQKSLRIILNLMHDGERFSTAGKIAFKTTGHRFPKGFWLGGIT